jgi:hypothetical protein
MFADGVPSCAKYAFSGVRIELNCLCSQCVNINETVRYVYVNSTLSGKSISVENSKY